MKEVKDLTTTDLMDEGRRWIIAVGDYLPGEGYRVEAIFENHPFRFQIGDVSNMPSPVPFFPAIEENKDRYDAAHEVAVQWSCKTHGIDKRTYHMIINSSIRAHHQAKRVWVVGECGDDLALVNGLGQEMDLGEEVAIKLYQDLADVLDLACQRNCPVCGEILVEDGCPECEEGDAE